eukprot:gene34676-50529_t
MPGYYGWDFDHFLREIFIPGRNMFGDWWEWHRAWQDEQRRHPSAVLTVSYDAMSRDLRQ